MKSNILYIILLIALNLSCKTSVNPLTNATQEENERCYTSKTFRFFTNSTIGFREMALDENNYYYRDSICDDLLIERYFPLYDNQYKRHEYYEYNSEGHLLKETFHTIMNHSTQIDSTTFQYTSNDFKSYISKTYDSYLGNIEQTNTFRNDTLFIKMILGDGSVLNKFHYKDSLGRTCLKVSPSEKSLTLESTPETVIAHTFNEHKHLVLVEKYLDGKFKDIQLKYNIEYDITGRKTWEEEFLGESLWMLKITKYKE